jgi:uncharacterized membrane protein YphA (DoxX/SURF4 family)
MLAYLLKPHTDIASLLLRWMLASIFVVHGYFKIDQEYSLDIPGVSLETQMAVGWTEMICGGLMMVGLLTRLACLPLIAVQIGAIAMVTWHGALMGPILRQSGADYTKVGPEFNLALITMCVVLIIQGAGAISLDHLLVTLLRKKKSAATAPVPAGAGVN